MQDKEVTTSVYVESEGSKEGSIDLSEEELPPGFDPSEIDSLVAQELHELSLNERNKIQYDVHGVADIMEEEDTFVEDRLQELDRIISKVSRKFAYCKAEERCPEFVQDRKLRLMFLRSESFDAKLAGQRLVRFFEEKLRLFGEENLTNRIRLSDLSEEDIVMLESGFMQLLPFKDRAGRAIFFGAPAMALHKFRSTSTYAEKKQLIKSMCRAFWYIVMTALEDEETQKMGSVLIGCNFGASRVLCSYGFVSNLVRVRKVLPERIVSLHYLFDDPFLRQLLSVAMYTAGKELRSRFRRHFGTSMDHQHGLLRYGIPAQLLPINSDGVCQLQDHKEWLIYQRRKEGLMDIESESQEGPLVPRRFDVLLGRGMAICRHTGNYRLGVIVNMYQARYEEANKFQKTVIAERLVKIVHESNGRFLKQEDCGWVEVDDSVARNKISHAFRSLRYGAIKAEMKENKRLESGSELNSKFQKRRSRDFGKISNNSASNKKKESRD